MRNSKGKKDNLARTILSRLLGLGKETGRLHPSSLWLDGRMREVVLCVQGCCQDGSLRDFSRGYLCHYNHRQPAAALLQPLLRHYEYSIVDLTVAELSVV